MSRFRVVLLMIMITIFLIISIIPDKASINDARPITNAALNNSIDEAKDRYETRTKDDYKIDIFETDTGKLIHTIDLQDTLKNQTIEKEKIYTRLSAGGKYLFISIDDSQIKLLFNIEKREFIDIPIEAGIPTEWSGNDQKVILFDDSSIVYGPEQHIWDLTTNELTPIPEGANKNIYWTPMSKGVYYCQIQDKGYGVHLFGLDKKAWKEVYHTENLIESETLEWISDYEFIFVEVRSFTSLLSFLGMTLAREYYAVKVDLKTDKITKLKLFGGSARSFKWSKDHREIYYINAPNSENISEYRSIVNFESIY